MSVQATEGCGATGCAADLNAACPAELQVRDGGGAVVACKSACTAFNTAEYCCTGDYSSPGTCPPTRYSDFFKSACPLAYSYAFDEDGFDLGACLRSDYIITFCPISLY
uniref:Thaumatin-like protein n=2 Tax=Cajanus cajan TaxID=3821 RepID=A0A151RWN7_CAJCA|nr:Thaumatin-like protein [Cajanus cajan]